MQVIGKFYIVLNIASPVSYFWSQTAQNWTTNPKEATFFDSRQDATAECIYAEDYGVAGNSAEVLVLQATKNID